ncbi:MAG: hypothetical protein AAGD18_17510 [Actinomycetota bacterium]
MSKTAGGKTRELVVHELDAAPLSQTASSLLHKRERSRRALAAGAVALAVAAIVVGQHTDDSSRVTPTSELDSAVAGVWPPESREFALDELIDAFVSEVLGWEHRWRARAGTANPDRVTVTITHEQFERHVEIIATETPIGWVVIQVHGMTRTDRS